MRPLPHILFITTLLFTSVVEGRDPLVLPDLGESSTAALPQQEAKKIGAAIYRQLQQEGLVVDDPVATPYIHAVGSRLLATIPNRGQSDHPFHFFIVADDQINAFALPGGYIGIHRGLIIATQNVDELASVVAHEIAHITQNHLPRRIDAANRSQLPLTVAIIAAILTGQGAVTEAAIASALATSQEQQLQFSRAHEREADSIGIETLHASGYNPRGMAEFFQRLASHSRLYGRDDDSALDFLQTHPVTTDRIADAESRAQQIAAVPALPPSDNRFLLVKTGLEIAASTTPLRVAERIALSGNDPIIASYARAEALLKEEKFAPALIIAVQLRERDPHELCYLLLHARLLHLQGERKEALEILQEGTLLYPHYRLLGQLELLWLLEDQQLEEARRKVHHLLRQFPQEPALFRHLARVETLSAHPAAANLATGDAFLLEDRPETARPYYLRALDQAEGDFYLSSRIEAKIQLTDLTRKIKGGAITPEP
ncbi:MAG: M48 family metallopeptidase [Gammaproteobacteria bacterium]|nr:M48 family metallopeptidase [Gammaproteobacteria bacterium]